MSQTVTPGTAPPEMDHVTVLRARDEIDVATARALRTAIHACLEAGHRTIEVDMSEVTFMDCFGLGAVVAGRRDADAVGSTVAVVRPSRPVLTVLELAGLSALLVIERPAPRSRPAREAS